MATKEVWIVEAVGSIAYVGSTKEKAEAFVAQTYESVEQEYVSLTPFVVDRDYQVWISLPTKEQR